MNLKVFEACFTLNNLPDAHLAGMEEGRVIHGYHFQVCTHGELRWVWQASVRIAPCTWGSIKVSNLVKYVFARAMNWND